MQVDIERMDDATIVRPVGRLDALTASQFSESVAALTEEESPRIVLDMVDVPYISSAGLRVVIQLAKQVSGRGRLASCRLSASVREVFGMAGFDRIMPICDELEEALQQLG